MGHTDILSLIGSKFSASNYSHNIIIFCKSTTLISFGQSMNDEIMNAKIFVTKKIADLKSAN